MIAAIPWLRLRTRRIVATLLALALVNVLFLPSAYAVGDVTPPVLSVAAVNGSTLTLTYNENLDPSSVPDVQDFTVSVAGSTVDVTGIAMLGTTVTLTLASPATTGNVVTVTYHP